MERMYFIGVTTAASSIHGIFPTWMAMAGIPNSELEGIDIPVQSSAEVYRAAIERIAGDPDARGALVTTHKVDVYRHAKDLFADFDEDARLLGEVSCIVKRGAGLHGMAVDPTACGEALQAIFGPEPFTGEVLIMGAGGAGLALAVQLQRRHRPARLIMTDVSAERVAEVGKLVSSELRHVNGGHDGLIAKLSPGALIVNATGLGKDRPGSPVTSDVRFPPETIAWDLNYRGDLSWLNWARAQGARSIDGWDCFLFGWSRIISILFGFDLTAPLLAEMREAATRNRR